jgi:hypothetical protein
MRHSGHEASVYSMAGDDDAAPTPLVLFCTMSFAGTDSARAHSGTEIDGGFEHRRGGRCLKVKGAGFATCVK